MNKLTLLFVGLFSIGFLNHCQSPVSVPNPEPPAGFVAAATVTPPAADYNGWAKTIHVDPSALIDGDGLLGSPRNSLNFLDSTNIAPNTLIALKRGTVLRLDKTIALKGGTNNAWVGYGAYGSGAKPIILGSVVINSWTDAGTNLLSYDWPNQIDTGDGPSATGPEQGPGNLWFFDSATSNATMTGWGWRKANNTLSAQGHFYYDASQKKIFLFWPEGSTPQTESAVNRVMFSFSGQSFVLMQDLDLRYGGNYLIRGHTAEHLMFRNLDMSYFGGGTKNGEYIRLGNGVEFNGNINDVSIEGCRIHQAYDTGFDQQHSANEGSAAVIQQNLFFRNNLVSYAGLASFEMWARPSGSRIHHLVLENNTFLYAGSGWGGEQHDFAGTQQVGGDIVIFMNKAIGSDISIQKNVFYKPRLALLCEWQDDQAETKALLAGLTMNNNLFVGSFGAGQLAVLYKGTSLSTSITMNSLAAWQNSSTVVGKDSTSLYDGDGTICAFNGASDPPLEDFAWIWNSGTTGPYRPQQSGTFALQGDYSRTATGLSQNWGRN